MKMYRDWAEFYDVIYTAQGQSTDIPFLLKLVREYGGPVLECACGTGRTMIPIAETGLEIHGMDTSNEMLAILEKKLSDIPKNVRNMISYEKKDMRDFDLKRKFKTCVIPFTSLYHLQNDSEIRSFFRCVNRHLKKNGVFIIDVFDFNPETPQGKFTLQATTKDPEGRTISKYVKTVFGKNQINDCTFRIVIEENGKKREITKTFKLHYLLHDQMWKLLGKEGFKVVRVYGNYDFEPYIQDRQNEKMIFVSENI